jgi:hypothetical protein
MFAMLMEVALFTLFVLAGVLFRKRPKIYKAAMLLANLSIRTGATGRMPVRILILAKRDGQESSVPSSWSALCSCSCAHYLRGLLIDGWPPGI